MKIRISRSLILISLLLIFLTSLGATFSSAKWGFFGHRRINRLAVFTLSPDMIPFFKRHVEYITEHAVDPDKRRYATKFEAIRHYIDIDHWGVYPFPEVPRDWVEALATYTDVFVVNGKADTLDLLQVMGKPVVQEVGAWWVHPFGKVKKEDYLNFFREEVLPQYYEDEWTVDCDQFAKVLGISGKIDCRSVMLLDRFSEYGIIPYHLLKMQRDMTEAFMQGDPGRILRLCAEMGHYIGDAHVPLHTTENYNGQLTDQVGIHAFWESRIPELFADDQYDFFVGKAQYIENPKQYFWDMVLDSHQLLDSVLAIEKDLSLNFPPDKQYCYEERLGITLRIQCRDYARAYQERLAGMVEMRMRESVQAIGSAWYTAWVDAGQPDLRKLINYRPGQRELDEMQSLQTEYEKGDAKGRKHEN